MKDKRHGEKCSSPVRSAKKDRRKPMTDAHRPSVSSPMGDSVAKHRCLLPPPTPKAYGRLNRTLDSEPTRVELTRPEGRDIQSEPNSYFAHTFDQEGETGAQSFSAETVLSELGWDIPFTVGSPCDTGKVCKLLHRDKSSCSICLRTATSTPPDRCDTIMLTKHASPDFLTPTGSLDLDVETLDSIQYKRPQGNDDEGVTFHSECYERDGSRTVQSDSSSNMAHSHNQSDGVSASSEEAIISELGWDIPFTVVSHAPHDTEESWTSYCGDESGSRSNLTKARCTRGVLNCCNMTVLEHHASKEFLTPRDSPNLDAKAITSIGYECLQARDEGEKYFHNQCHDNMVPVTILFKLLDGNSFTENFTSTTYLGDIHFHVERILARSHPGILPTSLARVKPLTLYSVNHNRMTLFELGILKSETLLVLPRCVLGKSSTTMNLSTLPNVIWSKLRRVVPSILTLSCKALWEITTFMGAYIVTAVDKDDE